MKNFKQNYKYKWLLQNYIKTINQNNLLLLLKDNNLNNKQLKNQIFIKAYLNNCLNISMQANIKKLSNVNSNTRNIKHILQSLNNTNYIYFDNFDIDLSKYIGINQDNKNTIIIDNKLISLFFFNNLISYKSTNCLKSKFLNDIKSHNIKLINIIKNNKINLIKVIQYKLNNKNGNN